jgi:nicotinate-nucleotide adenylyltransferase
MIGVFGGTFDPPHLAHAVLAEEAFQELGLEKVLWVLTPQPPHKPKRPISAVEHRIAMVELVTTNDQKFELSRADLDREPPHYAVGTIDWLRARYPGEKLAYIMGSDSLRDLPGWHDPITFVNSCDLIGVMKRKDAHADLQSLEQELPGLRDKVDYFEVPLLEISGHEIRKRVSEEKPYRYFLLPSVARYIESEHLYR